MICAAAVTSLGGGIRPGDLWISAWLTVVALAFARLGFRWWAARRGAALWLLAAAALHLTLGLTLPDIAPGRGGFLVNLGYTLGLMLASVPALVGTVMGIAAAAWRQRRR
ncbi:hypothetical protein [Paracoccus sp. (in: a-proteobacteria)]|uniref:hypothetical protein n=1 Tax=Paracoccus sp. TaxID=267 RepID=UPI0026DF8FFB|nr:hypothetical protein [Paracoccus sp. (in: a-proteobacteria)]